MSPLFGRALVAVLAAVGLIAVGCSADEYVAPPPAQGSEVADPGTAGDTLAGLQEAVGDGDQAAAGALGADDGASDLLASVAANARALGLTDLTFRYVTETGRTAAEDAWDGLVAVTWRIAGFDEASARVEVPVSFTDGGTAISAIGDPTARLPLWLAGPLTVVRAPGALVMASGDGVDLSSYRQRARTAIEEARDVLGGQQGVVVEVPGDSTALHRALDVDAGEYSAIAAVTAPVDGSRVEDSPVHVFVNRAVYDGLDEVAAQVVMTHEAAHAVTGAVLVRGVPLWLVEGFADYVALRDVTLPPTRTAGQISDQVRTSGVPTALPSDAEFNPTGRHLGAVYEAAWQVAVVLAARSGEPALVAFYRAVLNGKKLGPALREGFGWTPADLTAAWQQQLAALAGVSE